MLTFVRHKLEDGTMECEEVENDLTTQEELLSNSIEALSFEMSYRNLIDALSNPSDFTETTSSEWSTDADIGSDELSCEPTWESKRKVRLAKAATIMNYDSTE